MLQNNLDLLSIQWM